MREMTLKLIQHDEFLPDGESQKQHEEWKEQEAETVERHKANKDPVTGGIFPGLFIKSANLRQEHDGPMRPLRDHADGVERCPHCHWELEDAGGICTQCGGEYLSESEHSGESDEEDSDMNSLDSIGLPTGHGLRSRLNGDLSDYSLDNSDEELDGDIDLEDHDDIGDVGEHMSRFFNPATEGSNPLQDYQNALLARERANIAHFRDLASRQRLVSGSPQSQTTTSQHGFDAAPFSDLEDEEENTNQDEEDNTDEDEEEVEDDSEDDGSSLDDFIEDDLGERVRMPDTDFEDASSESSEPSARSSITPQPARNPNTDDMASDEDSDEGGRVTRGPNRRLAAFLDFLESDVIRGSHRQ